MGDSYFSQGDCSSGSPIPPHPRSLVPPNESSMVELSRSLTFGGDADPVKVVSKFLTGRLE